MYIIAWEVLSNYFLYGQSVVVPLSYPKAHFMVDLHHYTPIPSICHSGKQWIRSHHPQHCTSNQARVTVAWFAIILYSEGGQSVVVPLPYHKAHDMVDLHPICTNTKYMQLLEAMHVLTSPSTLSIQPSKGHCSLVCKTMIYWGWSKCCCAIIIPQGPCHGGFTSNMDLHQACSTLGINGCAHIILSIVHPTKQGSL